METLGERIRRKLSGLLIALGLAMILLAGLFPPLRRPDSMRQSLAELSWPPRNRVIGCRAFLLCSDTYTYWAERNSEQFVGAPADVDPGRLLAECLLAGACAGLGLTMHWRCREALVR